MVTRDEFIELLRSALGHLYDTERLRHSPLTSLLSLADQADPASALRNLLVDSVESLKPPEGVPAQSRDWRFYESLFYAYVQQLDQRIVSDQLGLSVRQLRREQRAAYEVLADSLWKQVAQEASSVTKPETRVARAQNSAKASGIIEKFAWLRDLPSDQLERSAY